MLKKIIAAVLLFMLVSAYVVLGQEKPTWRPTEQERADRPWIPGPDEVLIAQGSVSMPLGRILLARKGSDHCALKFINTWLGETRYDHYTSYELYYQGDGSGDFSKSNTRHIIEELFYPRLRGKVTWLTPKDKIKCGSVKLTWYYIANIGYADAELAPTPWTDITDVNIHDPKLQWYRDDKNRVRKTVHIDQLWERER